jgi:acyl-CoA synthetase (NDP forming)
VAVVGATKNMHTVNFNLLANLINLKFQGEIYPVNPNAKEILGLKAYPDLGSIEGDIDLAVIAVPASKTPHILKQCVDKGIKSVVIVAGGFAEIGKIGTKTQSEILSLLRENGIRAIGPNALSPINTRNNLLIDFVPVKRLTKGKLSFIFQSGLYDNRIDWLLSNFNLHLSKLIDLGNKMDINEVDALEYLAQDQETGVIAMHLESIAGDAKTFIRLLKQTSKRKPVIILKSGRTKAGVKAASSHTGAIIKSSDTIFDAVIKQAGAIRAETLDELFDFAKAFEFLPPLKRNRVAVATFPGGEGVIATDFCQLNGLTLAEFEPEARNKLRPIFPPWEISTNPFDAGVCGEFHDLNDIFSVLLSTLASDQNVDCAAIQACGPIPMDSKYLAKLLLEVIKEGKPVVTWVPNMSAVSAEVIQQLQSNRIPVFPSLERAIKALSALYQYNTRNRLGDELLT